MAITIFWEDEGGKILANCPGSFSTNNYIADIQNTCCLRFIDDLGDTTFNQFQIPVLIKELESIIPKSKDAGTRDDVESLIAFIQKAVDQTHTYIKFYGD